MEASTPRRGRAPKEYSNADFAVGQAPEIDLDADLAPQRSEVIQQLDSPLESEYAQALAFAEELITIQIEPEQGEFAPKVIECWVNGRGAEVLDPATGQLVSLGCLPVGGPITTKRKYVEVLARSKVDNIRTKTGSTQEENPENKIIKTTTRKSVFSVIEDRNPKGREWLARLMMER